MFLASRMGHFWHNRYLVDTLLFFWLFLFIVLSRRHLVTWFCGMVWLAVYALSSYTVMQATELNTVPWTRHAGEVLEQVQGEGKLVYNYGTFDVLYEYYLPNAEFVWIEDVDLSEWGDTFYVVAWGGLDFPYYLYEEGILEKEILGDMRLEEGVAGVQLWKMSVLK